VNYDSMNDSPVGYSCSIQSGFEIVWLNEAGS